MRGLAVGVLCAAAGCIEPDLVLCSNGLACPVGARCDEIHQTCVSPDQLAVCQGLEDDADCTAGQISGGCFDGVCLPRGCGNRVVETGEMCDDGNQISLDGCRSDCLSTEVCGNGFVDPGEPCDDGDLISRDGCDSRCQVEETTWSLVPISPSDLDNRTTAFDAARGRLVSIAGGTWEWDGARWTVALPPPYGISVFYDPDGAEVKMLSRGEFEELPEPHIPVYVSAWRDGEWVQVSHGEGPDWLQGWVQGTYDVARHRILVLEDRFDGDAALWTLDSTDSWKRLGDSPRISSSAVMAADPVTGHVLAETYQQEWVYDGSGWTSSPTSFSAPSLAFDPARGRLILMDEDGTVRQRIGAEWELIRDAEMPCRKGRWDYSPLYHNPGTGTLDRFSRDASEICRWSDAWTSVVPDVPSLLTGASYDALSRSFLLFHDAHPYDRDAAAETWRFADGDWARLETSSGPVGRMDSISVYSPGRAATVLYGGTAPFYCGQLVPCDLLLDAWTFDGAAWTPIKSPPFRDPMSPLRAATYDGTRRRVVVGNANELWSLEDTAAEWLALDTEQDGLEFEEIAWDARNDKLMAVMRVMNSASPQLFDLGDDGWARIALAPTALGDQDARIMLMSDPRRGGVFALDIMHGVSWERVGSTWVELPPLPLEFLSGWSAYNPVDGSLLVVGFAFNTGLYAATMTRSSATPLETCLSGEDVDGDGLAGCDDPECYWACSSCLPHTTCP